MRRCVAVAFLALFVLRASAGTAEFGIDLGTRTVGLWPGSYNDFPKNVRGGVADIVANVPLSRGWSVNLKAGGYEGSNHGKTDAGATSDADLNGLDGRLAFFATAPIVNDAVSVFIGVGATWCWFRYSSTSGTAVYEKVSENGFTVGVPAGLKLRLSRHFVVCAEMEVPDVGLYHDAVVDGAGAKSRLSWSQYGSLDPNLTAALYFIR